MIEILDFMSEHKKAIIAVVVMILCLLISDKISDGFVSKRDEAAKLLQDTQNKITDTQDKLNQPVIKYKELDHGYRKDRVTRDTDILEGKGTGPKDDSGHPTNEWLSRFLTWQNGEEYVDNRNWFVEKLGANNVFCKNIMRPYDPSGLTLRDSNTYIDANNIGCQLDRIEVYVDSIDESNNTYNYVVFAYFNADVASRNSMFDAMDRTQCYIINVSVDADGNVLPDTFIVSLDDSDR